MKTLSALQQTQASSPAQSHSAPPPSWSEYGHAASTLMLKSETYTEAAIILKRLDNGQDLSDLAQELFEKWVEGYT